MNSISLKILYLERMNFKMLKTSCFYDSDKNAIDVYYNQEKNELVIIPNFNKIVFRGSAQIGDFISRLIRLTGNLYKNYSSIGKIIKGNK